jgi:hypothetical protein
MRAEQRDDSLEWVIGRADTGDFIAVPDVAADVIRLLQEGLTVPEAQEGIRRTQNRDVDVADFVASLVELGFVRTLDGEPVGGGEPIRSTLPRLRANHVRWLVSPPVAWVAAALLVAAVAVVASTPRLLPDYRDLLWTEHTTAVLAGNTVLAWLIIGLHELAHLLTARAAGVGGRVSFGTRLQFLVAQTDVSGIWAAPRARRTAVYLAGIVVNLLIAAAAMVGRTAATPGSLADRLAAAIAILSLLFLPPQLLLFMRTDLYFVLQDLTGCRNLYADGSAHLRSRARRAWRAVTGSGSPSVDPLDALPSRERVAVRAYAIVLAAGTAACLAVAAAVTVPFTVSLFVRTFAGLADDHGSTAVADAVLTTLIIGTYWSLWGTAWWRRHGHRVTGVLHRGAPRKEYP